MEKVHWWNWFRQYPLREHQPRNPLELSNKWLSPEVLRVEGFWGLWERYLNYSEAVDRDSKSELLGLLCRWCHRWCFFVVCLFELDRILPCVCVSHSFRTMINSDGLAAIEWIGKLGPDGSHRIVDQKGIRKTLFQFKFKKELNKFFPRHQDFRKCMFLFIQKIRFQFWIQHGKFSC